MTDILHDLNRALRGRYDLEEELGRGGMATVYLARDRRHDRPVALKMLRPEVALAMRTDRFAREVRIAAALTHPHIVPVFDSGEAAGHLFYVMPFVAGESLRARLVHARRLDIDEVVAIAADVASALDFAHRQGTVHRDIKPENILIHDGHALVADFGIAKALSAATSDTAPETAAGMLIGTPTYMSPEQVSGDAIDGRSDLYSLGCVLFELLTGEPPFTGPSAQAVILRRLASEAPRVSAARRDVPFWLDRVVARLLQTSPADRFQTGSELIAALATAGADSTTTPAPTPGRDRTIAVLPFANLSRDPESEYFSDGITEDIIGALARMPGLKVASRSSSFAFKGKAEPMAAIAAQLKVGQVLEGSVRRAGNRVRITAQLVDVERDTQVWSERYDREMADIFAVQDEIATAIARRLETTMETPPVAAAPTSNLDAYHHYLKGRHLWLQRGRAMIDALALFQRAVDADPAFAAAHAGLADAYSMLGVWGYIPPAEVRAHADDASRRALALDDRLPEAHAARGAYELYFGWDLVAAERHLKRAVVLRPTDGVVRGWLAQLYGFQGRLDLCVAAAREARLVEPFSSLAQMLAGFGLAFSGLADEVEEAADQALLLAEHYSPAAQLKGMAATLRGDHAHALPWLERAVEWSGRAPMALGAAGIGHAAAGHDAAVDSIVEELRQRHQPGMAAWPRCAQGRIDDAWPDLDAAMTQRTPGAWGTAAVPLAGALAADPRWKARLDAAGLAAVVDLDRLSPTRP